MRDMSSPFASMSRSSWPGVESQESFQASSLQRDGCPPPRQSSGQAWSNFGHTSVKFGQTRTFSLARASSLVARSSLQGAAQVVGSGRSDHMHERVCVECTNAALQGCTREHACLFVCKHACIACMHACMHAHVCEHMSAHTSVRSPAGTVGGSLEPYRCAVSHASDHTCKIACGRSRMPYHPQSATAPLTAPPPPGSCRRCSRGPCRR
jgi:hypothetical protein